MSRKILLATIFSVILALFTFYSNKLSHLHAQEIIPTLTDAILPPCMVSDINKDGIVDKLDLSILRDYFFQFSPEVLRADINQDGIVDITDYSIMSAEYDISIFQECQ